MLLEDGYSAIYGERGEFNLITHEGWLDKTKGGHGEWNVSADRVTADADQTLRYEHAVFTSCDDHPSHFKFRSSKAKVVPKKYLLSYNNVFYLGNYPVFISRSSTSPSGRSIGSTTTSSPATTGATAAS